MFDCGRIVGQNFPVFRKAGPRMAGRVPFRGGGHSRWGHMKRYSRWGHMRRYFIMMLIFGGLGLGGFAVLSGWQIPAPTIVVSKVIPDATLPK